VNISDEDGVPDAELLELSLAETFEGKLAWRVAVFNKYADALAPNRIDMLVGTARDTGEVSTLLQLR